MLRAALRLSLLVFAVSLTAANAGAQVYKPISGSEYICGYLPDGTNKIFVNNAGNFEVVPFPVASRAIAKQRANLRKRMDQLNDLKEHVRKQGGFNAEMVASLAAYLKDYNYITGKSFRVPTSKQDRLRMITMLQNAAKLGIKNRNSMLDALRRCKNNERPKGGLFEAKVVVVRGSDATFVAVRTLVMTPKKQNGAVWGEIKACIRPNNEPVGAALGMTMVENPCSRDVFLKGVDCSHFVPNDKLGVFFGGHTFTGVAPPSEDAVNAAVYEEEQKVGVGFFGGMAGDCELF